MAKADLYHNALGRLRKLMARAQENRWYREVVMSRDAVLDRFGRVLSPNHVSNLEESELRAFLLFKNNKHWTGLQRQAKSLFEDIDRLRHALGMLLDETQPLAERIDYVNAVPGMGKALVTAILHVAYPNKYGVWNSSSEKALRALGIWPAFSSNETLGRRYVRINELLSNLAHDLQTDLWTLDALLWYTQTEEGLQATTNAATNAPVSSGSGKPIDSMATVQVAAHRPEVWWVNQGRTFRQESAGGYFWAPLRDRRGGTPAHWRRMEEVRPGDIVLHYSGGFIRAVSHVQAPPARAFYPNETDREYGQREGNLIRTEYSFLDPPVPLVAAANLSTLPEAEHPFTPSGAVQQGYLYRFGLPALQEMVEEFDTNWPDWLLKLVASSLKSLADDPALRQFVSEICDLNLGTSRGEKARYKPLMLLAAVRALVERNPLAFSSGPLLVYYRQFCEAVGIDPSNPNTPYFHLSHDGFWHILTASGERFVSQGTPSQAALRGTRVEIPADRVDCIINDELRPFVLGAIKTYFNNSEWARLAEVWPELARAVDLRGHFRSVQNTATAPSPTPDLAAITGSFLEALQQSNLRFTPGFVRTFVASLAAKPFAILTGLSGSGKTKLALQFGRWLGPERVLLVPVRPDWTGSDALFGYEDALLDPSGGRRAWHVPAALEFMLKAARDPDWPYLLILDEMNLAHVERYFADVLSGMESGTECLPNLFEEDDGLWRLVPGRPPRIPVPRNLFIVGTVNVDETTYMFSPKVLDRANTLEFRVSPDDLADDLRRPTPCPPGPGELVRGFLALAQDPDWHVQHPHPEKERISGELRRLHRLLHQWGFEFGHRVFTESLRFAAMLAAAGETSADAALDAILMQKILPRLHGNRRRLEPVLEAVGAFAFYPESAPEAANGAPKLNLLNPPGIEGAPRLPRSFAKLRRMMANLQANQFTSFAE